MIRVLTFFKSKEFFISLITLVLLNTLSASFAFAENEPKSELSTTTLNADHPLVKRAFDFFIDQDARNIQDLVELTEIPAPPFGEEKRAVRLAEMLKNAGLNDVSIDSVGNVVAKRPGVVGANTVAIVAHIDTVFPLTTDVTVRKQGNVYSAPGIGDNTRGLVVLISLARAFEQFKIKTNANILFVGSVGEEGLGDLRGVRHLLSDEGEKIDSFIAIDGGRNNRVIHKAVGSSRYRVRYSGDGGHSWGKFGAANPHHATARAIASFIKNAAPISKEGDKTTYNIGLIGGGTSINSITAESWFEVDMRSGNQEKLDDIDALFRRSVTAALDEENAARSRGDELSLEIKPVGKRPAGATSVTANIVRHAQIALAAVGLEARLSESSTDANIPMSMGIPAITISRGGRGSNAHSPTESWENECAHLSLQSAFLILLLEAGLSQN